MRCRESQALESWLFSVQLVRNLESTYQRDGGIYTTGWRKLIDVINQIFDGYSSDIVALRYVVDGNFTAQHMRMKRPTEDISLSDGLGYMVKDKCYQSHIQAAADNKDVCRSKSCSPIGYFTAFL
jgi:hypothetical protein